MTCIEDVTQQYHDSTVIPNIISEGRMPQAEKGAGGKAAGIAPPQLTATLWRE
jgi:hypothetical protein